MRNFLTKYGIKIGIGILIVLLIIYISLGLHYQNLFHELIENGKRYDAIELDLQYSMLVLIPTTLSYLVSAVLFITSINRHSVKNKLFMYFGLSLNAVFTGKPYFEGIFSDPLTHLVLPFLLSLAVFGLLWLFVFLIKKQKKIYIFLFILTIILSTISHGWFNIINLLILPLFIGLFFILDKNVRKYFIHIFLFFFPWLSLVAQSEPAFISLPAFHILRGILFIEKYFGVTFEVACSPYRYIVHSQTILNVIIVLILIILGFFLGKKISKRKTKSSFIILTLVLMILYGGLWSVFLNQANKKTFFDVHGRGTPCSPYYQDLPTVIF